MWGDVAGAWSCGIAKPVMFCWVYEDMEEECWGAGFSETGGDGDESLLLGRVCWEIGQILLRVEQRQW